MTTRKAKVYKPEDFQTATPKPEGQERKEKNVAPNAPEQQEVRTEGARSGTKSLEEKALESKQSVDIPIIRLEAETKPEQPPLPPLQQASTPQRKELGKDEICSFLGNNLIDYCKSQEVNLLNALLTKASAEKYKLDKAFPDTANTVSQNIQRLSQLSAETENLRIAIKNAIAPFDNLETALAEVPQDQKIYKMLFGCRRAFQGMESVNLPSASEKVKKSKDEIDKVAAAYENYEPNSGKLYDSINVFKKHIEALKEVPANYFSADAAVAQTEAKSDIGLNSIENEKLMSLQMLSAKEILQYVEKALANLPTQHPENYNLYMEVNSSLKAALNQLSERQNMASRILEVIKSSIKGGLLMQFNVLDDLDSTFKEIDRMKNEYNDADKIHIFIQSCIDAYAEIKKATDNFKDKVELEKIIPGIGDLVDYSRHKPTGFEEIADKPEGTVIKVGQTGYAYRPDGAILQFTDVVISRVPRQS
jgi:molecular chaperone GrpE (heat shock protein)